MKRHESENPSTIRVMRVDPKRTCVIRLAGNLREPAAIQNLCDETDRAIRAGRPRVVVDAAEVKEADTKLVAALVIAVRRARLARVALELLLSPHLQQWVSLCGLDWVLRKWSGASDKKGQ
ncbi:MAG: STAS domain-containing protein [Phycisphaerae bacterium]|nr:STAS domain-containing protein [Phycisphaerae bacterium]